MGKLYIHRYLLTVFILFQSFNSLGQVGQNYFKLTVINNSNGIAIFTVRYDIDTVMAGQKKNIVYELGDDPLSFAIFVLTTDTSYPSAQSYNLSILNTNSKKILITAEGKLEYELTSEEKTVNWYGSGWGPKKFGMRDSVIHANSNNLAAPDIIYWYLCHLNVPRDTIMKYYNMLSPEIRSSDFGKRIINYLENRNQLAIGKTLINFELPDVNGKIIQLKEIKSNYILLDFWFARCGACVASFPEVEDLYWNTKRNKLAIIGISTDKKADHELWLNSIIKYYMAWMNLNDSNHKIVDLLGIENYPTRILLDKDRKIVLMDTNNGQDDFFNKVKALANK